MPSLKAGARVAGRYQLAERLGQGGMGEVWAARHLITGKRVALKALKAEKATRPELVHRFFREARAATVVNHPNVVEVHDVLGFKGAPVMVMELLEGESLAALLARRGRLELAELAALFVPIVSAVGAAHARGIFHRDLKPENVFLARSAQGVVLPKVLDFGIAKLMSDDAESESAVLTRTGSMVGTPSYMSPEQAAGERDVDHRSDVWALGVMAFEALVGRRPFEGDNFGQVFKRIITDPAPSLRVLLPELPTDVADLVDGMLVKERATRAELDHVARIWGAHTDVTAPTFGAPLSAVSDDVPASFRSEPEGAATLEEPDATADEPAPPSSSPLLETLGATTLGELQPAPAPRAWPFGALVPFGAVALLAVAVVAVWSAYRAESAPAPEVAASAPARSVASITAEPSAAGPLPRPETSAAPPSTSPSAARALAKPPRRSVPVAKPPSSPLGPTTPPPESPTKLPGGILDGNPPF